MKRWILPVFFAAVLAYGWSLRCACGPCHCGSACRCPRYWIPSLVTLLVAILASVFVAVRARRRAV